MGRIVPPIRNHAANLAAILGDPAFSHVYFDISWDQVAKYIVATPDSTKVAADLLNRFPDRFLFGTDEVAPPSQRTDFRVYRQYQPLWNLLNAETSRKVRLQNHERIFNEARRKVRSWESAHSGAAAPRARTAATGDQYLFDQ